MEEKETDRDNRHASFTAVDPFEIDADQLHDHGTPRIVPYKMRWKRDHDAVYWFDLTIAQDKERVFWQTMCNAIILNDSMPSDCMIKVVSKTNEILCHKGKSNR